MSRIKKRGLDYFPMNTDFVHDRLVRRVLKREGDAALGVLLQILCSIYSGEGYYVKADSLFYDDLADCFYRQEPADVERIIGHAVECGLFDATLFNEYHILTSADIQRQFLFITKRRNVSMIDSRYNLIPSEAGEENVRENAAEKSENAAKIPETETIKSENGEKAPQSTQSIAKKSTAKHSKENLLPDSSPENGRTTEAEEPSAEEVYRHKLEQLQPPEDGTPRNLEGLLLNLRQLRIPLPEQYAIVLKSNFGIIGHPMWKGFGVLRESHGKIRQPGRYLLSLCR